MVRMTKIGNIEVWYVGADGGVDGQYYVYQSDKLVKVCPSMGMAREVMAGL